MSQDDKTTPMTGIRFLKLIKKHIDKGDTGSMLIGHPNSRMQTLWTEKLLGIQAYQQGYFHVWITEKGLQVLEEAERQENVIKEAQLKAESIVGEA